ncbi:hypothetical protein TSUD_366380 [Trifolium subterraneum]|uniref:Uncharacterized protein n=1 Tax=Trifolium subterraneum TaxID=3900 RepID=A0A2Z6LPQ4_TRISU|nr:hypothetical protein TSUD_366380 [Trifolium subterraneum]
MDSPCTPISLSARLRYIVLRFHHPPLSSLYSDFTIHTSYADFTYSAFIVPGHYSVATSRTQK